MQGPIGAGLSALSLLLTLGACAEPASAAASAAPGDVLFFLGYDENPAEPALSTLAEGEAWVWHMGMYTGGGDFIVGDHYAVRVVEEPLLSYLARHRNYAGVYAVRPQG